MYIVRKGYAVYWRSHILYEGETIPPQALDDVIKSQSWKVEETKMKKEEKKDNIEKDKTDIKLEDTVINRMIKDREVKKT